MNVPAIAIIGMACRYPDADTPARLWENALAQRRAFRPIPSERLSLADYAPERGGADTTYVRYAGLLEGYEFDRIGHRVGVSSFHAADPCQWLALDVAKDALCDAGFSDGETPRRRNTGVLVGNSLAGEFSRASQMRLRWPYVRRQLESELKNEGWDHDRWRNLLQSLEQSYKRPFPVPNEESLAGGLSNTIAGRICNHFGLHGGGFTVDGACASSLLAVAQACSALTAGDLDMAIAGGVDLSLDPFELVGFARTGALAVDRMRVYDSRPTGFLPGEGCGFLVLMRHADAIASGYRIHMVVRGWGMSSDGQGGLTRPEAGGQQIAIARAYERAGIDVRTVPYFEGHGTGTAVGDVVELKALIEARQGANGAAAAIGSIKALIGHTKAASGVAGLIKAVMAVSTEVVPPTAGCEHPHPIMERSPLRVLDRAEPWPDAPRIAGVNSMGFGGINVHVVIGSDAPSQRRGLSAQERRFGASAQDSELFVVDAENAPDAARRLRELALLASRLSQGELPDLAAWLARSSRSRALRIAVVATYPAELAERFDAAAHRLETDGDVGQFEKDGTIYFGAGDQVPRIGFLFPGQGSPPRANGGDWRRRFADVDDMYRAAHVPPGDEADTAVVQPAIVTASMAALGLLTRLGIDADVAVGHSLGEISALAWAGAFPADTAIRIAHERGRIMGQIPSNGGMASIGLSVADLSSRLKNTEMEIAAINAPSQTVVSGTLKELEPLLQRLRDEQIPVFRLPVSHAFHSRHVANAITPLRQVLSEESMNRLHRNVVSTVTASRLGDNDDLCDLLCAQLTEPVRFLEAIRAAGSTLDLWIEVGPGTTLGRLAALDSRIPALSVDACSSGVTGLLEAVAAAFVLGARPELDELFADRAIRDFDPRPRRFFANPCESAPAATGSFTAMPEETANLPEVSPPSPGESTTDPAVIAERLRGLLAKRTELPTAAISVESRLLSDLHLNSIAAGQAIVEAARDLGLPPPLSPMDFADARIIDIAKALSMGARNDGIQPALPEGLGHWLRGFRIAWRQRSLHGSTPPVTTDSSWRVIGNPGALSRALEERLALHGVGNGVALLLDVESSDLHDQLLITAAHLLAEDREATFMVVQNGPGAAGFARSLHLERNGTTVVVQVPHDHSDALDWVIAELLAARGFVEARYDTLGIREEPEWEVLDLPDGHGSPAGTAYRMPGPDEVLLVSGGGYGIAAESALAIATRSGCALALLGRSARGTRDELDRHLAHLDACGVRWRYYVADVTDEEAVAEAVRRARHELGPIAGVLHAAGVNRPRLASHITADTLHDTLAPKLDGLRHLVAALADGPAPRVFITFGSIIARIGLSGQAEYALANERLAHALEHMAQRFPGCRCLNIEWSVWSETGMGERLGTLEALGRQGIAPIAPAEGIAMLERLLATGDTPESLVVCGRFGRPPTIRFSRDSIPFLRFVERVGVHVPGVELVADAELSVDSDPYLAQHAYDGEQLLPAVVGLEAMAQATFALSGRLQAPAGYRFDHVSFPRPISVPSSGSTILRVVALRHASGVVDVALRSSRTEFQVDHFRASCRLSDDPGHEGAGIRIASAEEPVCLEPSSDIYGPLLPHGEAFQRLRAYRHLTADSCVADLAPADTGGWFRRDLPDTLLLGDPAQRDAAIHALQACVPHHTVLPVSIEQLTISAVSCGHRRMQAQERTREGKTLIYELDLHDDESQLTERWIGLGLRMVKQRPAPERWPLPLLVTYLERRAADLLPGPSVRLSLERGHRGEAHRLSEAMLDGRARITRLANGRPMADGGYALSHAYAEGLMLAVTGRRALGCDLEAIAIRPATLWKDMLGAERFRLAEQIRETLGENLDKAATRVWTTMESMKKAGLPMGAPLAMDPSHGDGWLLLRSGSFAIAVTILAVQSSDHHVAIAIAADMSI